MTIHQGFVSKMRLLVIAAVIAQTIRHILRFEMLLFTKEKILGLKGTLIWSFCPVSLGPVILVGPRPHIVLTGDWEELCLC